jgi:hypothetical protein
MSAGEGEVRRAIESLESLKEHSSRLSKQIRDMSLAFDRKRYEWFQQVFQDNLPLLLQDRAAAEAGLSDCRALIRRASLQLLVETWGPDEKTVAACYEMATMDVSSEARSVALYLLGSMCKGTKNEHFVVTCTDLIDGDVEHDNVRKAAYYAAILIAGYDAVRLPPPSLFRFPADVNWSIVDALKCRFGNRGRK